MMECEGFNHPVIEGMNLASSGFSFFSLIKIFEADTDMDIEEFKKSNNVWTSSNFVYINTLRSLRFVFLKNYGL